jgi:hypothetical protein
MKRKPRRIWAAASKVRFLLNKIEITLCDEDQLTVYISPDVIEVTRGGRKTIRRLFHEIAQ